MLLHLSAARVLQRQRRALRRAASASAHAPSPARFADRLSRFDAHALLGARSARFEAAARRGAAAAARRSRRSRPARGSSSGRARARGAERRRLRPDKPAAAEIRWKHAGAATRRRCSTRPSSRPEYGLPSFAADLVTFGGHLIFIDCAPHAADRRLGGDAAALEAAHARHSLRLPGRRADLGEGAALLLAVLLVDARLLLSDEGNAAVRGPVFGAFEDHPRILGDGGGRPARRRRRGRGARRQCAYATYRARRTPARGMPRSLSTPSSPSASSTRSSSTCRGRPPPAASLSER